MECRGIETRIRSLPVRGAWVEIKSRLLVFRMLVSLPVRGAWVEMFAT